jgi:hypothetical protein
MYKLSNKDKILINLKYSEFFEDKMPYLSYWNWFKIWYQCIKYNNWTKGDILPEIWYISSKEKGIYYTLYKLTKENDSFKIISKITKIRYFK